MLLLRLGAIDNPIRTLRLRADDRRNVCKRCYNMLTTSLRIAFIKIPKRYTRFSSLIIENKAGAPEPFTAN